MSVNNAGLARASGGVNALPLFYRYEYDQLNRLLRMRSYKGLNNASNQWTPLAINDYNEDVVYDPNGNILQYSRNGSPELSNPTAMDDLAYEYYSGKNQLKRVTDAVSSSNYTVDIDQQTSTENYVYDAIGNLIEDKAEGITAIDWTVYGKISSIAKSGGTIRYVYDAAGNRVAKMYNGDTTVYVRDASGNVMSVYERKQTGAVEQLEVHLYGSSRLGMVTRRTAVDSLDIPLDGGYGNAKELTFTRAEKIFELSNHLGNVLVTISDRRLAVDDGNGDIAYYEADVVTANDYYPFGMLMPGRSYSATGAYRYGFNGKENDNEVKGESNQIAFEARIYDPRLGRFLSCDPLEDKYPYQSTCVFAHNNPVALIDYLGMGDPPTLNWEYFSKRHVLSGDFSVNTPSGGTNSVITNPAWQNESTVKSFFNEALELAKKSGKTETNVTLKNGTKWSINTKTGHFNPISGEGITNLTNQEIALLRSAKKGGAAGETIFANIAKNKSLTGTFSEGMQTALNSLAKIEGITDATALKHIGGHLPASAATTELANAANKNFGSGAWKYAKWGGGLLSLLVWHQICMKFIIAIIRQEL